MSLASRAGDLFYTFRFIKLLVTNWTDTDAFKLGIIDENGKRIKTKKVTTPEEKSAYTTFHRLVYNVKKSSTVAKFTSKNFCSSLGTSWEKEVSTVCSNFLLSNTVLFNFISPIYYLKY